MNAQVVGVSHTHELTRSFMLTVNCHVCALDYVDRAERRIPFFPHGQVLFE